MFFVSGLIHPGSAFLYEWTRPIPLPQLRVVVTGDGGGIVQSIPGGIRCGENCTMSLKLGSLVKLTATIKEGSTFEGWRGPCGNQTHTLLAWADSVLFPLGTAISQEKSSFALHEFLQRAADPPLSEHPLECEFTLDGDTEIRALFGLPPEEVEVAMLVEPVHEKEEEEMRVALPKADWQPEELLEIPEEDAPDEIKKPEEAPKFVPLPMPQPPVEAPPPAPKIAETPKMKAVEVPDENEVEEAPENANFLSDKNRDVAEESHAEETNLEKQSDGKRVASEKSDIQSEEIGGEEAEIAQQEEMEETSLDADRNNDESLGAESGEVVLEHAGEDGEGGESGEAGDNTPSETPGLLSMRNTLGRGALGRSGEEVSEPMESTPGAGGERGRVGERGRAGPKLQLNQDDYARIVGEDVAQKEVAVARRKKSRRKGRWERKMGMLKSSLENFTPEVRPGNQTALRTRAAPFALYIARMHRRIHELWGFGFLEELDGKSKSHPLNDWNLAVKIEIVINPDGSIDKLMFARPSGILSFDVAALDVIDTSGPFEPTPPKIRSPDGKVYMHWTFHRDWRQCGTFGAEPFILSSPRGKHDGAIDDSQLLRRSGRKARNKAGRGTSVASDSAGHTSRVNLALANPNAPAAKHVANLWLSAFVAGKASQLASLSSIPFRSGRQFEARSKADIVKVYREVLSEIPRRRIRDWKLLSASGYRKSVGPLPEGIETTGAELLLVIRLKGSSLTMVLRQNKNSYQVAGLYL